MVKSKYLTVQLDWDERIRCMESDLENGFFDFLYFKIAVNMIDARDNADYDRETLLVKMMESFKENDFEHIHNLIQRLKNI